MPYSIEYFNPRVFAEIEGRPIGLLADYARMVELLAGFGPDFGMPHSRAMGGGLFELRPGVQRASGEPCTATLSGSEWSSYTHS